MGARFQQICWSLFSLGLSAVVITPTIALSLVLVGREGFVVESDCFCVQPPVSSSLLFSTPDASLNFLSAAPNAWKEACHPRCHLCRRYWSKVFRLIKGVHSLEVMLLAAGLLEFHAHDVIKLTRICTIMILRKELRLFLLRGKLEFGTVAMKLPRRPRSNCA